MEESFDYSDRSHEWLVKIISGDKPSSPRHVAALYELERRKNRSARTTSWISIVVALAALAFAAYREFHPRSSAGRYYFIVRDDGFFRGDTMTGEAVVGGTKDGRFQTVPLPFKQ